MENWIPAFAGMTDFSEVGDQTDLAEALLSSSFRPSEARVEIQSSGQVHDPIPIWRRNSTPLSFTS
jgi:hypothetical protein